MRVIYFIAGIVALIDWIYKMFVRVIIELLEKLLEQAKEEDCDAQGET